jgi:hypothetical protein
VLHYYVYLLVCVLALELGVRRCVGQSANLCDYPSRYSQLTLLVRRGEWYFTVYC